ncbi:MAG: hypothetical protein K8F24_13140, partial [Bacteroidales bacterium]|nr:hypothetical protein [Bacteroidales bacterium]
TFNKTVYTFVIDVKTELRKFQVENLVALKQQYQNLLLVADSLFPAIKETLRELNIFYLETNGNTYIKTDGLLLFIEANKITKEVKTTGNRAFTKTGLKVLFQFLLDKELINQPHRLIAEKAAVALGNIPQIISGLRKTDYIIAVDKKQYVWNNRQELLQRWIEGYETTLRPVLEMGNFELKMHWNDLRLNTKKTLWGAEPAADLLTNYLRPEKLILYTLETRNELIQNYKMIPEKRGNIAVYELFWPIDEKLNTAPPLLVYADLIIEGGKRNEETAKLIFDEFIKPNI